MSKPVVAIQKIDRPITQDSINAAVKEAIALALDGQPLIRQGSKVVLKPNIFAPVPPPTTTDPRVIVALIEYSKECGASEVIVAEGRSVSTAKYRKSHNSTRACAELLGITSAVESAGGKMVYLEEDDFVEVDVPGGMVLKKAHVPKTIIDADVLISIPAMKIHSLALVTLGIKNLHGLLSDEDKLFGHDYNALPSKLCDFLRVRTPDLTLIDGVIGQEADHAEDGFPVDMGIIIAGRDVVAVDAVTSSVMGIEPFEVDTTRVADQHGLGEGDLSIIRVAGESIESVRRPFARPDIDMSPERFPGLRIIAGDYCRSCQYYVCRGLDKLADAGVLDGSRELTVILGKEPPVPETLSGKVIMLGDCCMSSRSIKRLRNHLMLEGRLETIYACPPMQFRIKALELAGD
ncbi:MAG: DUF362 domain-containing protein [Armatimonadota bacterium]